ncbi:MAG TPA: hypothetical protein VF557_15495 [Jatrophihabitans sp.]|uniref:hypothetical protein n=1 Tax=Jatrophihabitans sp. TaxID=1932789 RepID=UPI002F12C724
MALPRTPWRRRPLLVLIILVLLLAIGYTARAFDGDSRTGSWPGGSHLSGPHLVTGSTGLNPRAGS